MHRRMGFIVYLLSLLLPAARLEAQAPPGASRAETQLAALAREVLERNPGIQSARRQAEARRARIPQARAWPDPRLSVGYGGNFMPPFTLMSKDPSSQRQLMLEQEIPLPGKTRLRGKIAEREAQAESFNSEAVSRRVLAELKQAAFDLYFTDRSLSILRRERTALQDFEKTAEIRYSVGKAAQQDVLKAQLELTRLAERETELDEARAAIAAQVNALRDRPADAPVTPLAEFCESPSARSFEELLAAATTNFPDLERQQSMVAASHLAVDLAGRETRPDFSVAYQFMQREGLDSMYGLTFSVPLPVFRRNKQQKAVAEAKLELEAAKDSEANELARLRYRVKEEFTAAESSHRLLKIYSDGILPQSALALKSSVASYETGITDFLTVLTNFSSVLESELDDERQLASHEKALARLEELTGLDLVHPQEVNHGNEPQ